MRKILSAIPVLFLLFTAGCVFPGYYSSHGGGYYRGGYSNHGGGPRSRPVPWCWSVGCRQGRDGEMKFGDRKGDHKKGSSKKGRHCNECHAVNVIETLAKCGQCHDAVKENFI